MSTIKEWSKRANDIIRQKQSGWFYHGFSECTCYYLYYKGEHILLIDYTLNVSMAL